MTIPIEETLLNINDVPQGEMLREMIDAGMFYGRKKSKTNPKMKPFIFSNRGGIEIIDLVKTIEGLEHALEFLKEKAKSGVLILFVGTQPAVVGIKEFAEEFHFPVVARRWIGGTLTNFKTISKRIERLKKLRADMAHGELDKYTKKERLNFEREIKRLEELVGGLEELTRIPDVLLVIDSEIHATAIREAKRLRIPVIAFTNTDADPDHVDYPVVGNNGARKSIDWFIEKVKVAIREGRASAPTIAAEAPGETAHG